MSLTAEEIKAIAQAVPQPQPAPGAISVQGINKYWPQIIGAVALGYFLMRQGKEQQALIIPPQCCALIYLWGAGMTAAPTFEVALEMVER